MSFQTWFLFFVTEAVLSLTPGLAVLYVISQGLRGGVRTSIWSTLGILSANFFYFAISATSLGLVLAASYRLFLVVKYVGAGYLVWLGLKSLFAKEAGLLAREAVPDPAHRIYAKGVALQLASPKALLFFTAIVPQFVNPKLAVGPQMVVLGSRPSFRNSSSCSVMERWPAVPVFGLANRSMPCGPTALPVPCY